MNSITRPPLILHVIHSLRMGGMENGVVNLVNNLPATRFRHAIACVEDYSEFRNRITRDDVDVIALHRSQVGIWNLRKAIYRLCRDLQPSIVHTRNMSGLDALPPAWAAGVAHRVHSEHGWDVDNVDGRNWRPALLRRLHAPLVERYVTVSQHLRDYLVERVGIAASRITHICNGVDTERFHPAAAKARDWLPPAFRDANLRLIGTVGRIQAVKDQATLLHAFARLVAQAPHLAPSLRLAIVGDGPLLEQLKALSHTLGIAPVTWFPGALDNVPEVLRALDLFVLPSLNEGISNTLLEALASGLPVIATAAGGNTELVVDGECGRFFAPRDTDALVLRLREYAEDDAMRAAHSQAARQRAQAEFSLATMLSRYQGVYDALLHRRAAS